MSELPPENDSPDARTVLAATDITKTFRAGPIWHRRRVRVLRGASLTVERGSLVGLTGENGSGKSTLMKIMVGMLASDSGSVTRPPRIGYCPQQALLWEKLTVAEHFRLFAAAYEIGEAEAATASRALLDDLNFERYEHTRVEELSGGTQQKLNLALSMLHDPDVLLLDEPYSGFDWETYLKFWEMSESRRAEGMGVLIVSHLLAERDRFDKIYAVVDGRCQLA